MKVLVADKFPQKHMDEMRAMGIEVRYEPKLGANDLPGAIADTEILIVRSTKVIREAIEAAQGLKMIIRAGAGVNTIDVKAATERSVRITNCPGKNSIAVAELAMGLILALDRRIPDNVIQIRAGKWAKGEFSEAEGLYGKTIGIVGLGRIGQEVAKRAQAFGMKVKAHDLPEVLTEARAAELGVERCASLEQLFEGSDIVTLHVPETGSTKSLVDQQLLSRCKKGAFLINTSRASVIDEKALQAAVSEGRVRAGLDVMAGEPEGKSGPFETPLAKLPGVYLTHHIGASTNQAQNAVADETLRIIRRYREAGEALNCVNPAAAKPGR
jgi:D-3-phosphoglycerate dehydrogenase